MVLTEAGGGCRSVHGRDQDVFCEPFIHEEVFPFQIPGDGGFRHSGEDCDGTFGSRRGMCQLICGRSSDGAWGGLPQEGGQSDCQVVDEVEWYGVVAVRRRQAVGVQIPGYSAEAYAPPVSGGRQGLLQGARAWFRAPGGAVGAVGRYGVRYRVYGEGSHRPSYVVRDDGAGVSQTCCAAFAMVYPQRVI